PATCHEIMFNTLRSMVGLCDLSGNLMLANRSALDFAQLTVADLKGKTLSDSPWWNPAQESCEEALEQVAQGNSLTFYFAQGEQELQLSLRPLRDEQGRVQAIQFEGELLGEALRLR